MQHVVDLVRELVHTYDTCNPIDIARCKGIQIEYDIYEETKGYFVKVIKYKYIVVNQRLNEFLALFVIAHELCHALIHHENNHVMKYEKGIYHTESHDTFISNDMYEREANFFAILLLHSYLRAYENDLPQELIQIISIYPNINELLKAHAI